MSDNLAKFSEIIKDAKHVVVIQAENPDGDSLASALALEHILGDQDKQVTMFCAVDIPRHLRHVPGWDRVTRDWPANFDASIIVDTSSASLLEKTLQGPVQGSLTKKPAAVIDHHSTASTLPFDNLALLNESAVATGEAIYEIATKLNWPLSTETCSLLATSIMYDSLGLSTEATTPRSIHIIAELVERGVSLAQLDERRRSLMKRSAELTSYKGQLLQRIEFSEDGQVATIDIPWEEIEKYSDQYNPSMLVIDDMRMTEGVKVAIAFKTYPDGRLTAKIRANYGYPVARQLAEHFDSGGHNYAAGFKLRGRDLADVKSECLKVTAELLSKVKTDDETV